MLIPTWVPILVSVFFGGLAGAALTNYIQHRKSRKQPVRITKELTTITSSVLSKEVGGELAFTLYAPHTKEVMYEFTNLHLYVVHFKNVGNKDLPKFTLGIQAPTNASIVQAINVTQGSQHEVTITPALAFQNPAKSIQAVLDPFNREDDYSIKLLISSEKDLNADDIKIDTKEAVKFSSRPQEGLLREKHSTSFVLINAFMSGILAVTFSQSDNLPNFLKIGRSEDSTQIKQRERDKKLDELIEAYQNSLKYNLRRNPPSTGTDSVRGK